MGWMQAGDTQTNPLTGYDTTANTTLFTTLILTLYKDIQDRVIEEIDAVYAQAEKAGRSELSYTEDFPRFRYLVAFMVRVYINACTNPYSCDCSSPPFSSFPLANRDAVSTR